MSMHLMTFVFASSQKDLWAVLGGLVIIAAALIWWVRRDDRKGTDTLEGHHEGPQPGPMG